MSVLVVAVINPHPPSHQANKETSTNNHHNPTSHPHRHQINQTPFHCLPQWETTISTKCRPQIVMVTTIIHQDKTRACMDNHHQCQTLAMQHHLECPIINYQTTVLTNRWCRHRIQITPLNQRPHSLHQLWQVSHKHPLGSHHIYKDRLKQWATSTISWTQAHLQHMVYWFFALFSHYHYIFLLRFCQPQFATNLSCSELVDIRTRCEAVLARDKTNHWLY